MRVSRQKTIAAAIAMTAAMVIGSSAYGQELLINGNFETDAAGTAGATGWTTYNFTYTSNENAHNQAGKSFKAFGPFYNTDPAPGSVGLQQAAVTPGLNYEFTGFIFSPTADKIQGQNVGVFGLRFLDSSGNTIAGGPQQGLFTSSSPLDTWVPYTLDGVAPANAVSAEVVIGHIQINNPITGGSVYYDDLSLMQKNLTAAESVWIATSSGGWLSASNWQNGLVPNAVGAVANFNNSILGPSNVTIAGAGVTSGTVKFNSPTQSYTVDGTGALTLDVATGTAAITVTAGSHAITAPVIMKDSTVVSVAPTQTLTLGGALTLATGSQLSTAGSGTLRITSPTVTGSAGASIRANGGLIQADADLGTGVDVIADVGEVRSSVSQHVRSLSISAGAKATLSDVATLRTLKTSSLTVATNGTLDLGDNVAIVDYTGTSPLPAIKTAILAGKAGNFAGTGIISSKVAANANYGIGYGESSAIGSPTSFAGETGLDNTTVLIKVTLKGDSNLSGTVDFDDLLILAKSYGATTGSVWTSGDADYNGTTDFNDLLALAKNYNASAGLSATEVGELGGSIAADFQLAKSLVPEPTTILALPLVAAAFGRRRARLA